MLLLRMQFCGSLEFSFGTEFLNVANLEMISLGRFCLVVASHEPSEIRVFLCVIILTSWQCGFSVERLFFSVASHLATCLKFNYIFQVK